MPCRTYKTSYFVCKLNSFNRVLNENVTPVEVLFGWNTTLSPPFVRKRQQLGRALRSWQALAQGEQEIELITRARKWTSD